MILKRPARAGRFFLCYDGARRTTIVEMQLLVN
jgi:hypothetical protein